MSSLHRVRPSTGLVLVRLSVLGLVALSIVVLSLVADRMVVLSGLLSVEPAEGIVLPATILLGAVGAWGGALGYALADALAGGFGALTVVGALGQLALGYVGGHLWWCYGSSPATPTDAHDAATFGFAALVGTVAATAVLGWGGAALGRVPFLVAVLSLPGHLVSTLVIGLPVLLFVPNIRDLFEFGDGLSAPVSLVRPAVLVPVVAVWAIAGTVVSIGFQIFGTVSAAGVRDHGLGTLLVFRDGSLVGTNVATIQSVLGGLALAALAMAMLRERSRADD